jgi:two-component sensor histidine kinase
MLEEKNLAIAESLAQREMLLKEIHHRVKNNLQIVSSLLNLQVDNAEQKSSEEILQLSQSRIQAMAIIHEKLYQSENLKSISLKEYIENLITYFERSYDLEKQQIKIDMQVEEVFLDIDVLVPCGLILNELITNSIKYAFRGQEKGIISIKAIQKDKNCCLEVADNGVGVPTNFDLNNPNSLGLRLVKGFTKQIKGVLKNIQSEKGTLFQIIFQT